MVISMVCRATLKKSCYSRALIPPAVHVIEIRNKGLRKQKVKNNRQKVNIKAKGNKKIKNNGEKVNIKSNGNKK